MSVCCSYYLSHCLTIYVKFKLEAHLRPVSNAMPLSKLDQGFDGRLKVAIHEVVIEDTWGATVRQLIGMCLAQMVPGKWPMIQCRPCKNLNRKLRHHWQLNCQQQQRLHLKGNLDTRVQTCVLLCTWQVLHMLHKLTLQTGAKQNRPRGSRPCSAQAHIVLHASMRHEARCP